MGPEIDDPNELAKAQQVVNQDFMQRALDFPAIDQENVRPVPPSGPRPWPLPPISHQTDSEWEGPIRDSEVEPGIHSGV